MIASPSNLLLAVEETFRLSDVLKRPVRLGDDFGAASSRASVGWLADLVIEDKDVVAEVTHICVGQPFGNPSLCVPWKSVQRLTPDGVLLKSGTDIKSLGTVPEGAVLLGDYILDKKVLDVGGREIEVVYDVMLAVVRVHLLVIAVDLSRIGMLRRLGLGWLGKLFYGNGNTAGRQQVPWNLVEPLPEKLGSFSGDLKLKVLKDEVSKMPPVDVARILEQLSYEQRMAIFFGLENGKASDALEELDPTAQRDLIAAMPKDQAARLINEMTQGQAADVLSALPWSAATAILRHMDKDKAAKVQEIMNKQEEEVIDYVISDFIKLTAGNTVLQARQSCQQAKDKEAVACLYIVDSEDKLTGVVDTTELLRTPDETLLKEIVKSKVVSLSADSTLKEAAEMFERYGLRSLPVTDHHGKLLGVVPSRDVLELKHHYVE